MTVKIPILTSLTQIPGGTMSSRDHPCNRSTRPLLMERKTQLLTKKKSDNNKMHGFNDFDIISQQYKNLNTHIGYPYGSPPSPTVNSNDFIFSDDQHSSIYTNNSSTPKTNYIPIQIPNGNYQNNDEYNNYKKISKFNDFDWRTSNTTTPSIIGNQKLTNNVTNCEITTGPFIFGVHNANTFNELNSTVINTKPTKYSIRETRPTLNQSNSDTSASSNGTDSRYLVKSRKETTKKKRNRKEEKIKKENRPKIKCVLVGDGAVGKTNLIVSYLENRFLCEHVPTASDIYNAEVMVNDSPVHITLCDTAGQDTLDPLRELSYPDSDVFLLCFSIVKPETFHSIKTKWAPKFSKTKASLILVGTQADLRNDSIAVNKLQMQGEKPISFSDAWDLANSIGAKYIETSSFTQEKVKDVFDTAIWDTLLPNQLPPTPPLWKKLLCLA